MIKNIELKSLSKKVEMEYPNICPKCNSKISPDYRYDYLNSDINIVTVFYTCPFCNYGFISYYELTGNTISKNGYQYEILNYIDSFPKEFRNKEFSEYINNLSPSFCEIYNQSLKAENDGLNQISGMGYRKSLEFLIKDYCVKNHQKDEDKIKSMQLSQVINEYVEGAKLKSLAKASTWLGNDETHYVRKFENKDINDLKKFIDASVSYIEYEMISDDAQELLDSK